jgi:hypothetical protein
MFCGTEMPVMASAPLTMVTGAAMVMTPARDATVGALWAMVPAHSDSSVKMSIRVRPAGPGNQRAMRCSTAVGLNMAESS